MHQNIYSYSTHSSSDWLKAFKKRRTGQTQFSTKFAAKLNFMPRWSPVYFFFLFLNLVPYVTKQDQTGGYSAVFAWLYGWLYWQGFLQGLGRIPETTAWKQLNTIMIIFLWLYENARHDLVPQLLPMTDGFTNDIFRTPQMTARPWSQLLALERTFKDSTDDSTTMDGSRSYGKTLKSPDKFSKDPKRLHHRLFLANAHLPGSFCRQLWKTLWNGQWDKCICKGWETRPYQVASAGCSPYQPPTIWQTITYQAASVGNYDERCGTDNTGSVR